MAVLLIFVLLSGVMPSCMFAQERSVSPVRTNEQRREEQQQKAQLEQRRQQQMNNAARQLELRGNHEAALQIYLDLADLDTGRNDYFSGIIRNLVALGRYDEAITKLETRLNQNEHGFDRIRLLAELGSVYHQAGDEDRASQLWEQALGETPHSTATYQIVASELTGMRLLDKAEEVFRRGRAILGDSTLFSINLATLLQARMDWEGAAREYLVTLRGSKNRGRYVQRSLAAFPNIPDADSAIERVLKEELEQARRGTIPYAGYEEELLELQAGHAIKHDRFEEALQVVLLLDSMSEVPGRRLLDFAAEASNEGHRGVAEQALAEAARRFQDPEGRAVATMTLAMIAREAKQGVRADSLLSLLLSDPVSARVERAARFQRGVLRLELLNDAPGAAKDFESLLLIPDANTVERLRYLYAVALAKMDSLDLALAQLGKTEEKVINRNEPPPMPSDEEWQLTEADAAYLEARIALWLGRPATAADRIQKIFTPPTGANAENEALDLLHIVSTTQDSGAILLYADADRAEFQGRREEAVSLFDSLTVEGQTYIHQEAAYRAASLRFAAGQDSALIEYADHFNEAPHAEEALFVTAVKFQTNGDKESAKFLYEDLLMRYPDGLLAPEARLLLDEISLQE